MPRDHPTQQSRYRRTSGLDDQDVTNNEVFPQGILDRESGRSSRSQMRTFPWPAAVQRSCLLLNTSGTPTRFTGRVPGSRASAARDRLSRLPATIAHAKVRRRCLVDSSRGASTPEALLLGLGQQCR